MMQLLLEMQSGVDTPRVQAAMNALRPAMEQLKKSIEGNESGTIITV